MDTISTKMDALDPACGHQVHACSSPNDPSPNCSSQPAAEPSAGDAPWTLDPPLHPSQLHLLPSGTVKRRMAADQDEGPLTSSQQLASPHPGTGTATDQGGSIWGPAALVRGTWPPAPATPSSATAAWAMIAGPTPGGTPATEDR
jgi:hypothetical protein